MSNDIDEFLKTLKVHNKDLEACFNDAVAVTHLKLLIAQEANKAYEKGSSEQIRKDNDFIKHVQAEARINELTRLDNAYDEVTPDNFHEYYIKRIKALTADKEQNNGL